MLGHPIQVAAVVVGVSLFAPAALRQAVAATGADLGVFAERDSLLVAFSAMPAAQLQTFFLRCSRESGQRLMGLDEAIPCAMAWDVMLKRQFSGNVDALLAWWRVHRDDAAAPPRRE